MNSDLYQQIKDLMPIVFTSVYNFHRFLYRISFALGWVLLSFFLFFFLLHGPSMVRTSLVLAYRRYTDSINPRLLRFTSIVSVVTSKRNKGKLVIEISTHNIAVVQREIFTDILFLTIYVFDIFSECICVTYVRFREPFYI